MGKQRAMMDFLTHLLRKPSGAPGALGALTLLLLGAVVSPKASAAGPPLLHQKDAAYEAVKVNHAVKALEKALEAARARVQSAGSWANPSLVSQYQLSTDAGNHMLTLGLRQPLDFRGITSQRQIAAEDEAFALEIQLAATRRKVAYQARRAYVTLWLSEATEKGQGAALGFLKAELERGKKRVKAGALAPHELIHTEFEWALAQQRYTQAKHEVERARIRLNVLLERPISQSISLPPVAQDAPPPEGELNRWLEEARLKRPEPNLAKLAARQERRGAKMAELMRFGEGEIDLEGGTAGPYAAPMLYGAFTLPIPLWNNYAAATNAHQAEAARQEAHQAAAEAALKAEVTDAWIETRQAAARVEEVTQGSLTLAAHALEKAQARVASGAGAALEVVEARQQELEAKTQHIRALLNYHLARLKLEEAVGR